MIDRIRFTTGVASGSAGAATASGHGPHASGELLAVHVAYRDSPPATTDVTLEDAADPAGESIVSLASANTDVRLYPRRVLQTNDGTELTYDGTRKVYGPYVVHGRLKATIAGANAGDYAVLTIWLRR